MPTDKQAGAEDLQPLEQCLLSQLQRWQTSTVQRIWIGFSGGLDSTTLLLACCILQQRHLPSIQLGALHAHHGLSAQADGWLSHCQRLCEHLGVPLRSQHLDVSSAGNLEANARRARYSFFRRQLTANDILLLGHHQQDQLETILQRLFSGRGLLPMRQHGQLGKGHMLRPFLRCTHAQLQDYSNSFFAQQRHQGFGWVEDPSNANRHLQRNFLRHEILPRLSQHWPALAHGLLRVASQSQAAEQALVSTLAALPDQVLLSLVPKATQPRIAWLRSYLAGRGCHQVSDRALGEFSRQLNTAAHAQLELPQPPRASLHAYQGKLYFEATRPTALVPRWLALNETVRCAYGVLRLQPVAASAPDAFVYKGPLWLHTRRGGERLSTGGGHSASLKQLLQQAQVPPWQRRYYPLLSVGGESVAGETVAGELVCVPGLRISHNYAADPVDQLQAEQVYCRALWQPHTELHLSDAVSPLP